MKKIKIRRGRVWASVLGLLGASGLFIGAVEAQQRFVADPAELQQLRASAVSVDRATLKRWLHIDASALSEGERQRRAEVVSASKTLTTVYTMREELAAIWKRSTASKEQLVRQLEDWCRRAEDSGIEALRDFSRRLRCYA